MPTLISDFNDIEDPCRGNALRLLDKLDLTGKVVTGDAIFCQKTITSKIADKSGDYLLPVERNQNDLLEEIETAFLDLAFSPEPWHAPPDAGHGRIDQAPSPSCPHRHSPTPYALRGNHCAALSASPAGVTMSELDAS